jgi:anti-sigma regulatory factor (Ser/Thr protein kinase)
MVTTAPRTDVFCHEALLYSGEQEFVDATASFIRDAVAADEPVLVVVGTRKIDALRSGLGRDASLVQFADMADVGTNPARIIPAWYDFVEAQGVGGHRFRGVGEPISSARTPAELIECQRHEALLNLAFEDAPAWWLLCPYDVDALDPAVVEEARRSHPYVAEDGIGRPSSGYVGVERDIVRFEAPLPDPPSAPLELSFDEVSFERLRKLVSMYAVAVGLHRHRREDVVVAVNELAGNSVRHGGGSGVLRIWKEDDALVCEVRDGGRIDDPLAGRRRPPPTLEGGRGLWLVNQLCDLVQVRSDGGNTVRVFMRT